MLDTDYYFRLIDMLREAQLGQALLLYQDVLTRGFGGQSFLTGLCEHIRNLMVSLDPQTLSLVEGGERLRARYGAQAQQCGLALLLNYLNIASDFEYRFREANNKRLFVEICITRLATSGQQ